MNIAITFLLKIIKRSVIAIMVYEYIESHAIKEAVNLEDEKK